MTLRAALRATMALVAVSLASVLPAAAQTVTPPGGAVFGIGAGATATSASVVMTMPNGTKIPIGVLNPTTGVFSPSGLGAVQTTAAQALSAAQASLQPGNALSELVAVSANARANLGLGAAATLNVGTTAGTVAKGDVDPLARGALQSSTLGQPNGPVLLDANGIAIPFGGLASPPASAGQPTGTGNLPISAVMANIIGWDGSPQFRVGTVQGAAEFYRALGGLVGNGPVLRAESDTSANVNGALSAKGSGAWRFGNDYGTLFDTTPIANTVADFWTLTPAASGSPLLLQPSAKSTDQNVTVGLKPKGTGGIVARTADGTATGGTLPGANAVDLQAAVTGVLSGAYGPNSALLGGQDNSIRTTSARGFCMAGFGNVIQGTDSGCVGGQNGADFGRRGFQFYSAGLTSYQGDAENGATLLYGTSTGGAAVRLTSNAGAATNSVGSGNCVNFPASSQHATGLDIMMTGRDTTTPGHYIEWYNHALMGHEANSATIALYQGTASTLGSSGDSVTVSLTGDTTNVCLNATVTPGSQTGDTWLYRMAIRTVEG